MGVTDVNMGFDPSAAQRQTSVIVAHRDQQTWATGGVQVTPMIRKHFIHLLVTVASVAAAAWLTMLLASFSHTSTFFVLLIAVMIATWDGGLIYGLIATALVGILTAKFVIAPAQTTLPGSPNELLRWALFVLVALLISSFHASKDRTAAELRNSEQRLKLALDSAHMGVWDYDLISRRFWWSATMEIIYDRTNGNFPRTYGQFFGCIHFDDQPQFNRAITRTIDEGTDYEIAHRIILPDKSIRWVQTRGRVIFNQQNRAERIVGISMQIPGKTPPLV